MTSQLQQAGLGDHYVNHGPALFYHNAAGNPWTVTYIQAKGDPIADLYEDIAAEEKARATYEHVINLTDDVDIQDSLKFRREREIIHALRFREAVEMLKEYDGEKKVSYGFLMGGRGGPRLQNCEDHGPIDSNLYEG